MVKGEACEGAAAETGVFDPPVDNPESVGPEGLLIAMLACKRARELCSVNWSEWTASTTWSGMGLG
jgi:hypothetical protein